MNFLFSKCNVIWRRPRSASGQALASHRWGPELASRSLHVGFVVDETGSGQVFRGVSPVLPYHKFHSTTSPHSSHPFRSISSALVMVRQAWSAGTLATHGPIIQGLHRISSFDPTFCWTRVQDIMLYGAEIWTLDRPYANKLLSTEMDYWRRVGRNSRIDKIRNQRLEN